jgi:hypothetical protein
MGRNRKRRAGIALTEADEQRQGVFPEDDETDHYASSTSTQITQTKVECSSSSISDNPGSHSDMTLRHLARQIEMREQAVPSVDFAPHVF